MAITIHHGPNGSYKSSGVVQDRIVPHALKPTKEFPNGRVVVTNLNGITLDKFYSVFGDKILPEFDVVNVDTRTEAGIERLLKFWHWVPMGALLVIDEAQLIFLKRYREADLDKLDYKTIEEATADNRPHSWLIAWTQHRHWNWDIILITPDIDYLRDDIRLTSEGAYLHANAALIGFKGRYKEGFHKAKHSGHTASHILGTTGKKIKPDTFRLYESTQTGVITDTPNGINLLASPRLFLAFSILACALGLLWANGGIQLFSETEPGAEPAAAVEAAARPPVASRETVPVVPVQVAAARSTGSRYRVGFGNADQVDVNHPLAEYKLSISGRSRFGERIIYQVVVVGEDLQLGEISSEELFMLGYSITPFNKCLMRIRYQAFEQLVGCKPRFAPTIEPDALPTAPSGVHGAPGGAAGQPGE